MAVYAILFLCFAFQEGNSREFDFLQEEYYNMRSWMTDAWAEGAVSGKRKTGVYPRRKKRFVFYEE